MARFLPRMRLAPLVLTALIVGGALIGATAATAGPGVSTSIPFAFTGTNPCTEEAFTGTGNLHFLISNNLSSSGMIQFHIEVNFSGLQAVTIPSTKKYVVIDQENQTDTFDPDGMPAHETVEHTLQFVRSGEGGTLFPDDDFYEHFLAHVTANANGTVTVQDIDTDTRCQ
jgi:hypothetical protein